MAIETVPPLIAAQLNYLVSHCPFSVKVEQMWSGCKNPNLLDRFTLVIPYCLDFIRWDFVFNAVYPLAAPDVIFGAEDETFQPYSADTEKSNKNSLVNWNSKDPTSLLSLITELRDAYVSYQRRCIIETNDERLNFEVDNLNTRQGIEMYMNSIRPEEVKFTVPLLDMDLNKLVAGSSWKHQQKICLQVIYPAGKKSVAPRLKLVSAAELKTFFSIEEFKLPPWFGTDMCLALYLPTLEDILGSQIKDAVSSIETRRKFIMSLEPLFGRPVEADPVFCRRATFLSSSGVFTFLVHFSISLQFPNKQPAMLLQSTQHFSPQGVPVKSSNLTEYPWSPRWDASQMAVRIFEFLADESLNFKKYCNQMNQQ